MGSLEPLELAFSALALMLTGCLSGFMAGMLGVGGGIIVVPILGIVLPYLGVNQEVLMHVAVGTSLATIIPNSFTAARLHFNRGTLDPALLKKLMWPILVGVIAGCIFGGKSSGRVQIGRASCRERV